MDSLRINPEIVKGLQQLTSKLRVHAVHGPRVLVSVVKARTDMDRAEEMGLAIPESAKETNQPPPSTGIVVKVGKDAEAEGWTEGQAVMFSPYAGSRVSEMGVKDKYVILDTTAILCTLEAVDADMSEVINIAA